MSKIKIVLGVGIVIGVVMLINWISKAQFIDVFAAFFIILSFIAIVLTGLYVVREAQNG